MVAEAGRETWDACAGRAPIIDGRVFLPLQTERTACCHVENESKCSSSDSLVLPYNQFIQQLYARSQESDRSKPVVCQ